MLYREHEALANGVLPPGKEDPMPCSDWPQRPQAMPSLLKAAVLGGQLLFLNTGFIQSSQHTHDIQKGAWHINYIKNLFKESKNMNVRGIPFLKNLILFFVPLS